MAQAIIATITDTARTAFANMLQVGRSFTITDFVTGSGGHDNSDPAVALTPDPTVTVLPLQSFGPKPVTSKTLISPFCVEYLADLDLLEAVGPISNIGLIATYLFSPIGGDVLVGTTFLFAISNTPLSIKTDSETRSISIQVGF
jgi:hypothetical protein